MSRHDRLRFRDNGSMSRREFLGTTTALGAAGVLGMTLPGGAAYATPRRGGTLKLGLAGGHTTDTMDPLTTLDNVQVILCWATYNNLVELNEKREAIPELAESWEAEPGAKVWHFNLRKDAEFHNGKSLDADDVIYSLNRHRGPDTKSGSAGLMKSITDIKKTSKHQVRVELAGGNADLPYVFSAFHLCITPAEYSDWANPVGTGPYRMTAYEAGVRGAGERDPNYWKEGRAHVDSYEVTAINDETARMNALRSGEVHIASLVSTRLAAKLDAEPGIGVVRSPGPQHYTMPMDVRASPFSDNHVRMALKHSIDREGVLNSIASGYGSLGNDHPIGPSDPFYNHELPIRPYDPDKAKWHLKQAGMDSLSVDLSASEAAGPGGLDLALLLQESAKASGIAINLVREPADGYWANVWLKKPFMVSFWNGRETTDMMLTLGYSSESGWNETHFLRDDFDALLAEARALLDFDRRREIYWELQRMLSEEGGSIIPIFNDFLDGFSTSVGGAAPDAARATVGARPIERCWLEA